MTDSTPTKSGRRWYHLTPDRFLLGLAAVEVFLFLSEQFRWLAFNEKKGWTVLIGMAVLCLAGLLMLLWMGIALLFRRRFQFSLRSLLGAVVVVAMMCSWFTAKMQQAKRQKEAVIAIERLGGSVFYDYEGFDRYKHPILPEMLGLPPAEKPTPPYPTWLNELVGGHFLSAVKDVSLWSINLCDDDLMHLKNLHELEYLSLGGDQITNNGLRHIRQLNGLRNLSIEGEGITDAGLQHVGQLNGLRQLAIISEGITGAGLQHLKGLTELEELALPWTRVTDAGMVHLKNLSNLHFLNLRETQVTDAGLEHLKGLTDLLVVGRDGTRIYRNTRIRPEAETRSARPVGGGNTGQGPVLLWLRSLAVQGTEEKKRNVE